MEEAGGDTFGISDFFKSTAGTLSFFNFSLLFFSIPFIIFAILFSPS